MLRIRHCLYFQSVSLALILYYNLLLGLLETDISIDLGFQH